MTLPLAGLQPLAEGLDHPEGVAAGPDGMLYAGGEDGQIYRIDPEAGAAEQIAHLPGRFLLGVAADARGRLYLCDSTHAELVRFDPQTGEDDVWCAAASGTRLSCPNWAAFAPDGSLWLTDSGSIDVPDGTVVRVGPGGGDGERLELGPLHYPNGCALGAESELYLVESMLPGISVVRDGRRELLARLERTVPDGIAVCADGSLVVAVFQPNQLIRVSTGGEAAVLMEDWTGQTLLTPTNVAFFGADHDRLAVASVCGWSLGALPVPFRGRPIVLPEVAA